MSDHVNRREAERLLTGQGDPRDRLAALLSAVATPGRLDEWRGEPAALAAFRSAQLDPVADPRRPSMLKTAVTKLLTVKIGLICAASLGLGGVAYAASTDALPGPLHGGGGKPAGSHRPYASTWPSTRPSRPAALAALCHDYAGRDLDHRGKALDDPTFHDLIGPAGGRDRQRFDDFCARLDHDWPSGAPSGGPGSGPSGGPGSWPGGGPGRGAGGGPGDHASGRPDEHPSGHPGQGADPSQAPHPSGVPHK